MIAIELEKHRTGGLAAGREPGREHVGEHKIEKVTELERATGIEPA
jgi:hypothetical protein